MLPHHYTSRYVRLQSSYLLTTAENHRKENNTMSASAKKVRVAIIGVGNCASSLVQGVEFYRNAVDDETVPGLMHVNLGGYHIRDIEFSAAFDVADNKVGRDLAEAITAPPNNTITFAAL